MKCVDYNVWVSVSSPRQSPMRHLATKAIPFQPIRHFAKIEMEEKFYNEIQEPIFELFLAKNAFLAKWRIFCEVMFFGKVIYCQYSIGEVMFLWRSDANVAKWRVFPGVRNDNFWKLVIFLKYHNLYPKNDVLFSKQKLTHKSDVYS